MAKINTGTITAAGDGTWSSNAINFTAGAKRTYMVVNGVQSIYRDFTVANAISIATTAVAADPVSGVASTAGLTIPSGALVVGLGMNNSQWDAPVFTATGLTFTERGSILQGTGNTTSLHLCTAVNSGATLNNTVVNFDAANEYRYPMAVVYVLTGANTSALTNVASNTGTSGTAAVTITRAASTSLVFALLSSEALSVTPSNLVSDSADVYGLSAFGYLVGHSPTPGSGSLIVGTTWASSVIWTGIAIDIQAQ